MLIGVFVAAGAFLTQVISTGVEFDPEWIFENLVALIGVAVSFFVLVRIFGIVADAFAINITYNAVQGVKVTLSEA